MDITALRHFKAAIEAGNLSKASDELYISRQALSKTIKRMEEQLGFPLIRSIQRGIEPTEEGRTIYTAVQQMLKIWDETLKSMDSLSTSVKTLRVGFGHNSYNVWAADHPSRYQEKHTDIRLELQSMLPDLLLEGVKEGALDLAVSNVRPLGNDFLCVPLVVRPMYAFLQGNDPLAKRRKITPQDLHGRTVVFIPDDETGMIRFRQLMEGYGLSCSLMQSPDSTLPTICTTLALHQGVFITSAIFYESNRQRGFVRVPFETGVPHSFYNLDINAVALQRNKAQKELAEYIEYLKTHVRPEFLDRRSGKKS